MAGTAAPGEGKAWNILGTLNPGDVCKAASVSFDSTSKSYVVKSFGMDFFVSPGERNIRSSAPESSTLLQRFGDLFRLSMLWYLVTAKDVPCTGRLTKLQSIRGGEIFTTGSHILPLDKIAQKYGSDKAAFLEQGRKLGGGSENYGDASVKLFPLPRFPVIVTLWTADEEFPAKADLMLDSTCEFQIPTDIIWSIALISVLVMV